MTQDLEKAIQALKLDGECVLLKAGVFPAEAAQAISELLKKPVIFVEDFDDIKLLKAETVQVPT